MLLVMFLLLPIGIASQKQLYHFPSELIVRWINLCWLPQTLKDKKVILDKILFHFMKEFTLDKEIQKVLKSIRSNISCNAGPEFQIVVVTQSRTVMSLVRRRMSLKSHLDDNLNTQATVDNEYAYWILNRNLTHTVNPLTNYNWKSNGRQF